jgi:hypothetical protein
MVNQTKIFNFVWVGVTRFLHCQVSERSLNFLREAMFFFWKTFSVAKFYRKH